MACATASRPSSIARVAGQRAGPDRVGLLRNLTARLVFRFGYIISSRRLVFSARKRQQVLDEPPVAARLTIYTRVPEGRKCDTMWANCESPATLLILQEFNRENLVAWRCDEHRTD